MNIQSLHEELRRKRERYLCYLGVSIMIIAIGFMSMLAFTFVKIILAILLVPTFFGGYSSGVYARNWTKEFFINAGRPPEDAEMFSLLSGIAGGVIGTIILAGIEVLLVFLLLNIQLIEL